MLVDIEERMNYIRKKVTELGKINFFTLTEGLNKYLTVATFVALLELARQKILTVKQARQFGNIIISAEGNVKA
jgi:chromatin segregation and condensation protein Rec8/ScpA/Scc1 (kleisin family)